MIDRCFQILYNTIKLNKKGIATMFTLFTYGTLMKGNPNDHYLRTSKYLGHGTINNVRLYDYVSWDDNNSYHSYYPVALNNEYGDKLIGEVYEVPDEMLQSLEYLEGVPVLYTREVKEVTMSDGTTLNAFTYIGNPDTWVEHIGTNLIPYDTANKYKMATVE